ncbi:MAG: right-handed parallel beta-helix repeat-containing protein [Gammaproteobacteria bacterium]|nr:right-handed parallel beta-helix repeat-containing protein [Gammaproteobacteria bacterium]MDH3766836.1 right-handed parallel beta-helix repeat-containing protein [Gammaproteobacteria bacterium]
MTIPISRLQRALLVAATGASALLAAGAAGAFPQTLNAWQDRYDASDSGTNAVCQLCHVDATGGSPWNGYGWDIRSALGDLGCDLNTNGVVSNEEAFFCVELDNSDGDGSGHDNITEIGLGTQPGWTEGAFNTYYSRAGTSENNLPPDGIGPLDPDGTEPPPPPPPMPPDDDADVPPGQLRRPTIVVRPGDSIQTAIDRARPGTRIYILAGTYSELQNPTNGLTITKNGISLIGQRTKDKRVVFENAGNQRNGIVVVPEDRADCMSCHTDLAPPFPVHEGVPMGLKMREPMMHGIEIRDIAIQGFRNNGLFTENVDGFKIIGVESIDNRNYGIFPTLSKNGLISHSKATGSDLDSGIWVETSENVTVQHSVASGNVNGFEVSNSDDILLAHNVSFNNTVGAAILLLPDIFDDRPGAKRIDLRDNNIHDNNKPNTARPGSILSFVPSGTGVLYLGVDQSMITNNLVENNDFVGIAIADYCVTVTGTPFDCGADPSITLEFLADHSATGNVVIENTVINNGTNVDPANPFGFAASDLALLSTESSNCYADNIFNTAFSIIGVLPPCP